MAPPRRAGLRAGLCTALLASASGLRLPAFVTDAAAALLGAAASGRTAPRAARPAATPAARGPASYPSELVEMPGHTRAEVVKSPLPATYVAQQELPAQFSWGDVNGVSFLTRSLNQHVPQCACPAPARRQPPRAAGRPRCEPPALRLTACGFRARADCGSCWAHATASVLADRIKIARGGRGVDIGVSIQWILNCGAGVAGSCHGGSTAGAYDFIERTGFVPFDTCLAYEACSAESTEGKCGNTQGDYTCNVRTRNKPSLSPSRLVTD